METIPAKKRKVYTVRAKNFDAQHCLIKTITEPVDRVTKRLSSLTKKREYMIFRHHPRYSFVNLYLLAKGLEHTRLAGPGGYQRPGSRSELTARCRVRGVVLRVQLGATERALFVCLAGGSERGLWRLRQARRGVRIMSPDQQEGIIVNRYALAAALALTFGSNVHATAIEVVLEHQPAASLPLSPISAAPQRVADLAAAPRAELVTPPVGMSELPEPEVFAMMLVGLILIGYRARRDSDEKFK
jgi:hypothetical protein